MQEVFGGSVPVEVRETGPGRGKRERDSHDKALAKPTRRSGAGRTLQSSPASAIITAGCLRKRDMTLGERLSPGKGKSRGAGSSQHLGGKWGSGPGSGASPTEVNNDPCRASKILLCKRLKWETEEPGVGRQVYCSV